MKKIIVKEIIDKLPLDLTLKIIPYTYNLQNKDVLDDINNYKETKSLLLELYYKYWIIGGYELEPEDKNWLINDIYSYLNEYNATMYGYIDKFYDIFKRNILIKTNEDVDNYIRRLNEKESIEQINIILGLLTPEERCDIVINFQNNII